MLLPTGNLSTPAANSAAAVAFFFFLQSPNQIRYHTYVTKNDQKE